MGTTQDGLPPAEDRDIGAVTHLGRLRTNNEDTIMAADITLAADSIHRQLALLMVADGLGGCPRGEEASRIAVDTVAGAVVSRLSGDAPVDDTLREAIRGANGAVLEYVRTHPGSRGMGTTLVCAIVKDGDIHLASIGDSRAYVAGDTIRQVTRDHNHAQDLLEAGQITPEEYRCHPGGRILTRAIGTPGMVDPDLLHVRLSPDESLLLCSDGLTLHLSEDEILDMMCGCGAQEACRRMVDEANRRGGRDNISVVILSHAVKGNIVQDPQIDT